MEPSTGRDCREAVGQNRTVRAGSRRGMGMQYVAAGKCSGAARRGAYPLGRPRAIAAVGVAGQGFGGVELVVCVVVVCIFLSFPELQARGRGAGTHASTSQPPLTMQLQVAPGASSRQRADEELR